MDVISRQDAIDAINELHDRPNAWLDLAVDTLEKLPSAQPKHGKWNKIHWKAFRCSECNRLSEYNTNFCPNCGAKMEG